MNCCRRLIASLFCVLLGGCQPAAQNEVVVYAALDREFSEPILKAFEQESGVTVLAKYDVESTKTVGLTNLILQERSNPRCDLFWNNEILQTLRLEKAGVLRAFVPSAAEQVPPPFKSKDGKFYGFAARARVLLVNTELVPEADQPQSIQALTDAKWKAQCGIAKPLFGTTATHAAVLFATWGDDQAKDFFQQVFANALILSGNKQVAEAVGKGQLAFGLTDTDDAIIEVEAGRPVKIIFPDQAADELGCLFIPNTLCLIHNAKHAAAAERLANYLLQPAVEAQLAACPSAQIPILSPTAGNRVQSRVEPTTEVRWMSADFPAAADHWETTGRAIQALLDKTPSAATPSGS